MINDKDYEIIDTIGKGVYGIVYKARYNDNIYAIKKTNMIINGELESSTVRETSIIQHLDHPNIIKAVDIGVVDDDVYIVMPYIGPTLQGRKLEKSRVRSVMWQLLLALKHMEDKGVMHRDIKPSNIVMNDVPVIIDFSISSVESTSSHNHVVTPMYRTPELYKKITYDIRIDVWSMGIIMFNILTGKHLFQYGGNDRKYITNVISAYRDGKEWLKGLSTNYPTTNMVVTDGPYLPDILDMNGIDTLEKEMILFILQLHYDDIPSVSSVLEHPYFHGLSIPDPIQRYISGDISANIYIRYKNKKPDTRYDHTTILWACLYLSSNCTSSTNISVYKKIQTSILLACALDIYNTIHYNLLPLSINI